MRVLVACEFSGIVRQAFRDAGHNAWSCDVLPAEDGSPYHIRTDVEGLLLGRRHPEADGDDPDGRPHSWDLMIAHPPCTFLANSANKHLYIGMKKSNGIDPRRWHEMTRAAHFFRELLHAPVPRIAVENPIMLEAVQRVGRKPDQIIQPWQFGHGEIKATCLWLKNLPPLQPTQIVDGRKPRVHHEPPSADRWKNRSRTLPGIAAAMATQWGSAPQDERKKKP